MNVRDYNKVIILLIKLIVTNNAFGVANALKATGYDITNFVPASELERDLLILYNIDPNKFFSVMASIPWNPGHKNTNEIQLKSDLIRMTGSRIEEKESNWWPKLITLIKLSK